MRDAYRRGGTTGWFPSGFTLLETVVATAVAIVAVAALLPSVQQARQGVVTNACLANQASLGVGAAQYVQEFNELPGIQYHEGTYWTKPWGLPYYYGGITAWAPNGGDFWNDYLYGPNPNKPSGFAGIGYVYPYVGGNGKNFYCPGTASSFYLATGTSPNRIQTLTPWYGTWTGEPDTGYGGFQKQGRSTLLTYFYRSGMYPKADLADSDPRWVPGNPNWNWTRDNAVHPSDPFVQNQPTLTCFWYGYRANQSPGVESVPHGGTRTNLLYTDGSTRTWKLPSQITPVWGWFDAGAYTKSEFRTGSFQTGFITTGYPSDFYTQMPWWWIEADRAN